MKKIKLFYSLILFTLFMKPLKSMDLTLLSPQELHSFLSQNTELWEHVKHFVANLDPDFFPSWHLNKPPHLNEESLQEMAAQVLKKAPHILERLKEFRKEEQELWENFIKNHLHIWINLLKDEWDILQNSNLTTDLKPHQCDAQNIEEKTLTLLLKMAKFTGAKDWVHFLETINHFREWKNWLTGPC